MFSLVGSDNQIQMHFSFKTFFLKIGCFAMSSSRRIPFSKSTVIVWATAYYFLIESLLLFLTSKSFLISHSFQNPHISNIGFKYVWKDTFLKMLYFVLIIKLGKSKVERILKLYCGILFSFYFHQVTWLVNSKYRQVWLAESCGEIQNSK